MGGNSELVAEGDAGALVPAGDVDALAAGVLTMAVDPALAAAGDWVGRVLVERRISPPAMVAAYQGLYGRLLAERAAKPDRG